MSSRTNLYAVEIHASAWEFPGKRRWEPDVFITWNDGSEIMDKLPNFAKSFPNHEEAEGYGITFALKWIDDGKPPLGVGTRYAPEYRP